MLKTMKHMPAALALTLICFSASLGQQPNATATPNPESDAVTERFKSKVFEVKYRDANSLANVLYHLGSGFKGATVSASTEFKTITVRDFPENLVTIEEAIKRLDVPAPPERRIAHACARGLQHWRDNGRDAG
jgi:type II secretory pathway component GspD/PulD (secretin)